MLSRRALLASGLAAIAAPAFAQGSRAPLGTNFPLKMRPGIQLYMVAGPLGLDAPGTLKALHEIGYRSVQAAGTGRHTPKQFRRLLDDAGLACPACHLNFTAGDNGALFETANILGASFAGSGGLYGAVSANPAATDAAGFRRMAQLANRIGAQAKKAGLGFVLHNHNTEFQRIGNQTGFDLLLQQTDPALVGIEMDVGWVRVAGSDPVAYLRAHPNRFPLLHIKDFIRPPAPRTAPGNPGGAPLGRGFIDYRPVFAAAKGVKHYFVEQEPPYRDVTALQAARIGYQYLEKLG
jgi:sugar phosphate isomerase/epimerase